MDSRPYWNMEVESRLGSDEIAALQLERLRDRVGQLFEHAPYFRHRMQQNGIEGGEDIRSLTDWARAMPPFTKADYRALVEECGNDIYRFLDETLPVPLGDLVCMAATSGTTGDPQPYPFPAPTSTTSGGSSCAAHAGAQACGRATAWCMPLRCPCSPPASRRFSRATTTARCRSRSAPKAVSRAS